MCGISWWSRFFFFLLVLLSRCLDTICWRGYFYSILCFCRLCWILINHRDMGLFLGSLFCSIHLCVCSYASTKLFWLLLPCNIVWYQVLCIPSTLFFFFKIAAAIWHHLCFHITFWNVCFISVKYVIVILIGITW